MVREICPSLLPQNLNPVQSLIQNHPLGVAGAAIAATAKAKAAAMAMMTKAAETILKPSRQ